MSDLDEVIKDQDKFLRPVKRVLKEVQVERLKQHLKWGHQRHEGAIWLTILSEEVGESAEALLRARSGNGRGVYDLRSELVQVAAVVCAWIEAMDDDRAPCGEWHDGDIEMDTRP